MRKTIPVNYSSILLISNNLLPKHGYLKYKASVPPLFQVKTLIEKRIAVVGGTKMAFLTAVAAVVILIWVLLFR